MLTVPADVKPAIMPNLAGFLRDHDVGNVWSLVLAAAVGGGFALVVGLPLMRLSGLAAGIATFAVLEITHNVLREWTKIGPGAERRSRSVPETTDLRQAAVGALLAIVVAFAYQRSRSGGCCARRGRTPPRRGPSASRSTGSGCWRSRSRARSPGFAGGLYVHLLPLEHRAALPRPHVHHARDARRSAARRASGARSSARSRERARLLPRRGRERRHVAGRTLDLPEGTRLIVVGALMALVLILRPSGLTGGRELSLPRFAVARTPEAEAAG